MLRSAGRRSERWLAVPFLLVILVLNVTSMWHKSATVDEPDHLKFGRRVLSADRLEADRQRMPMTAAHALFSLASERIHPDASPRTHLFAARLPTVLLSVALGWLVFSWSREMWGWQGGLFSLGLYTFSPNVLAHSHWITNDLSEAFFVLASLYSFMRYMKRRSLQNLVICGFCVGAAQATKHSSLLLFPLLGALWSIDWWKARRSVSPPRNWVSNFGKGAAKLLAFGAIALLVLNACYLFKGSLTTVGHYLHAPALSPVATRAEPLLDLPLPFPNAYVDALLIGMDFNATGGGHGPNYLLGERDQFGWWYYYLVALALKTPLGLFVLLALSARSTAVGLRRGKLEDAAFVLLPSMFLVFFSSSTAQIGVRYLLPIFPLLFVSLGRLTVGFTAKPWIVRAAIALSTGWMVLSSLSYHPHYLSYFNELIGDRKNMYKYLADSNVDWEQNQYYLEDYLAKNADRSIALKPKTPTTGTVIVSLNKLVGVTAPPERFAWLRSREPVDHIAYTYLVFEIDEIDEADETD